MTTAPSALLPIFRSEAQARLLAWLLLDPTRERPIAQLTGVSGAAQPNTLREVNRLVQAGLLKERRAGNARLVSANTDSPYFTPLVQILGRAYGPASVVPEELRAVSGIDQAVIIGSWAERYLGVPGPPPRDVDVVVVGAPDRRELRRVNAQLEARLDQPVQVTVVTSQEWESRQSAFVDTARSRPHLVVVDAGADR